MSQAVFGKGTLLQAGDVATPTGFVTVPEVKSIKIAGFSAEVIDVTSHDTPGGFRDKKQGLKDWGTVQAQVNYVPTDPIHQQIFDDMKGVAGVGVERYWQIVFPDTASTTFQFKAFVNNFAPSAPIDNVLVSDLEVTILGNPEPTLG
jgi:predicted secreted protein